MEKISFGKRAMRNFLPVAVAAWGLGASACGETVDSDQAVVQRSAEEALRGAESVAVATAVLESVTANASVNASVDVSAELDLLIEAAINGAIERFGEGCVDAVESDDDTVLLSFTDCKCPATNISFSGTTEASFTAVAEGSFEVSLDNTFDISAAGREFTATSAFTSDVQLGASIATDATFSFTGEDGASHTHEGTLDLSVEDGCLVASLGYSHNSDAHQLSAEAKVCADGTTCLNRVDLGSLESRLSLDFSAPGIEFGLDGEKSVTLPLAMPSCEGAGDQ